MAAPADLPKHIVITGASKGIGAALAKTYAEPGVTLGLVARNEQALADVAAQCTALGARVRYAALDMTNQDRLVDWLQQFEQQHPIDLLIANAGITHLSTQQDEQEPLVIAQQIIAVNLSATMVCIDTVLPAMRQRRRGQIALISSLSAYRGMPITPAYSASKAAVKNYGEALRGWLHKEGIRINVVCPGFVDTDMTANFHAPTPFTLSTEQAVSKIRRGLARNQAIIAFPFPLNLGMWCLSWLPFPVASFFLGLSGYNRQP